MSASEEFDEAIDFYKRLVLLDETNASSWHNLGLCYLKKKKYLIVRIIFLRCALSNYIGGNNI